jgi:CDP-4-dehydro-6-deoxyglucose reductase
VVVDRFQRTPRILELRLRPLGDPLRYWPGPHVLLGNPRAGAPPRSYSIANAPRPDGELILLVTRQPGGATSGWIHEQLLVGDETSLTGPYGTFIGDPSVETPVLCLAAGSGLAPILALTDAALRRGFAQPVTLLFSARSEEDVYHRGLMKYWEVRHRRFRFIRTLTGGDGPPPIGRIPEVLPAIAPDLSSYSVFIAGSPQFVEDCNASVRRLGAQPQRVHTEGYFPQAVPSPPPNERLI